MDTMDNVETQKKKVLSVVASLRLKVAIIPTSQWVPFEVNCDCEVNTDALPYIKVIRAH